MVAVAVRKNLLFFFVSFVFEFANLFILVVLLLWRIFDLYIFELVLVVLSGNRLN